MCPTAGAHGLVVAGHVDERVIEVDERSVVFPVDRVLGLYRVPRGKSETLPATVAQKDYQLLESVSAVDGRDIYVIDAVALASTIQRSLA